MQISGLRIWNRRNGIKDWEARLDLQHLQAITDKFLNLLLGTPIDDEPTGIQRTPQANPDEDKDEDEDSPENDGWLAIVRAVGLAFGLYEFPLTGAESQSGDPLAILTRRFARFE